MKTLKLAGLFAVCSLIIGAMAPPIACAAEYYVIYDSAGKAIVVDSRPADASVIIQGPFGSYQEAEIVVREVPARVAPAPGPVPPPGPAVPPVRPAPVPPAK